MGRDFTITAESVTEGHPDKICDQISDAILDDIIKKDKNARVACETAIKNSEIWVFGEIATKAKYDIKSTVKNVLKSIGYTNPEYGIDYRSCEINVSIENQSPDISSGILRGEDDQGAGDQGIMFGYACTDTPELMPAPITLAHRLAWRLAEARKSNRLPFLRPDGKCQVTVRYENGIPVSIENITIAAQHDEDVENSKLKEGIIKEVIEKAIPKNYLANIDFNDRKRLIINGTGRFVIGGPKGDAGLTGRKIIIDTYGGFSRHGGGAFSGKDPSKVDRSAAYMARYIAKNIVAAGLAEKCEVQLAYTIGISEPNNVFIDTFGTGKINDYALENTARKIFPLKPGLIIKELKLKNPIYLPTATYGHFGKKPFSEDGIEFFTWEKTDKKDILRCFRESKRL